MPTEEIQIETDVNTGKKIKQKKRMEQYAPLIFEECYVKHKGLSKVANAFELEQDPELRRKIDPTAGRDKVQFQGQQTYSGLHLFILVHGFQGSSFDMRTLKNVIAISLPEAIFLCSGANE